MLDKTTIINHLDRPEGFSLDIYDSLPSTNATLSEKARTGAPPWSVVIADHQTAGRGRNQRPWHSPPDVGIWMSILMGPRLAAGQINLVNLITAHTVAAYLEGEARSQAALVPAFGLKWPNDIWVAGKKMCGILLESSFSGTRLQFVILGIGININQTEADFAPDIRGVATSLRQATGVEWSRERLIGGLLSTLQETILEYLPHRADEVVDIYRRRMLFVNEFIQMDIGGQPVDGIVKGVNADGYLLVEKRGKTRTFTAGEIQTGTTAP